MAQIISITHRVDDDLRLLLSHNVLGSPNHSMVYQQMRTLDKIDAIDSPIIASIRLGTRLVGACCFCMRQTRDGKCHYIRYFTFSKKYRSNSVAVTFHRGNGLLRDEVRRLLAGEYFENDQESILYAYVDPRNVRSKRLCKEFGFHEVRNFRMLSFSRLSQVHSAGISKLLESEYPLIRKLLREHYENYSCYTEENLFYENNFYVLLENGEIKAGVQANFEHWHIKELPGRFGKQLLRWFDRMPIFNQLISADLRFLALDYLYCPDQNPATLERLLEGVLAVNNYHVGLIALDQDSNEYRCFDKLDAGLLNVVSRPVSAQVIAKVNTNRGMDLNYLRDRPFFISTYDLT